MNKTQLVDTVAKESNLKKSDVETMFDALLNTIMGEVAKGEKVQITGFGSFERKERSERTVRNPKTQEEMIVPASKVPGFSAGSIFKEKVNI